MTVTVINDPPNYVTAFSGYATLTIHILDTKEVVIPAFFDTEGGELVSVTEISGNPLTFTYTSSKITIAPNAYS